MSFCCNKQFRFKLAIFVFGLAVLTLFLVSRPGFSEDAPVQDKKPAVALRDPMMPVDMSIFEVAPQKTVTKRAPYKVQGIGRSDKTAYAIIGGKVYQEGETKGGLTVVKVSGTQVDILVDGQPETLLVKEK